VNQSTAQEAEIRRLSAANRFLRTGLAEVKTGIKAAREAARDAVAKGGIQAARLIEIHLDKMEQDVEFAQKYSTEEDEDEEVTGGNEGEGAEEEDDEDDEDDGNEEVAEESEEEEGEEDYMDGVPRMTWDLAEGTWTLA